MTSAFFFKFMSLRLINSTLLRSSSKPTICMAWIWNPSVTKQGCKQLSIDCNGDADDQQPKLSKKKGLVRSNRSKATLDSDVDNQESQVTLLDTKDVSLGLMSLTEAENMAKSKKLKLVKLEDTTKERQLSHQVYKLMTGKELYEARITLRKEAKSKLSEETAECMKSMVIGGKPSKTEIEKRTKTIQRWMSKGHAVLVTISADKYSSSTYARGLYTTFERVAAEIGGKAAIQKHKEGQTMKFILRMDRKMKMANTVENTKDVTSASDDENDLLNESK